MKILSAAFLIQLSLRNDLPVNRFLYNKQLIEWLLFRLKKSRHCKQIFITVSSNENINSIEKIAMKHDVKVLRGNTLFDRYRIAFEKIEKDIIVRLGAESCLIDPLVIDRFIDFASSKKKWDLIIPRGYPLGSAPVLFNARINFDIWNESSKNEHPLYYILKNPHVFKILGLIAEKNHLFPQYDFRINSKEQLKLVKNDPRFFIYSTDKLIKLFRKNEEKQLKAIKKKMRNKFSNRITKRVLFLDHAHKIGGSEISLFELLRNLDIRYSKYVLLPKKGTFSELLIANGIEVFFQDFNIPLDKQFKLSVIKGTLKIISDKKIDLIYANTKKAIFFANLLGKLTGIKVIAHVRDLEALSDYDIGKMGLYDNTHIITNSKAVKQHLVKSGVDPGSCKVIYNGVDLHRFYPNKALGNQFAGNNCINSSKYLIGFIGQMYEHKGLMDLVDAFFLISKKIANAFLCIAGSSLTENNSFEFKLKERIKELQLVKKVKFLSFVSNVNDFINMLDVLIVPSHTEPFGRVVIEGLAAGVPVVATNTGGIPEIIENGYNGFLVPVRNPEKIYEKVVRLKTNKKVQKTISDNGIKAVKQKFQLEKCSTNINKYLNKIYKQ